MENREDKDFFRSLPKKELQDLCKRYGLSPYMTKSNLVSSLSSYTKKKNLSSISQVESSSVRSTSLITPLEHGAESENMVHTQKESCQNIDCPREKDNRELHSQPLNGNEQGSFMVAESYKKESGFKIVQDSEHPLCNVLENSCLTSKKRQASCSQNELGCNENGFRYRVKSRNNNSDRDDFSFAREVGECNAPQIQGRNLNPNTFLAENASASFIKSSKAVPSFEFYVTSEVGINLVVDLNSSPSDWSKILESEMCSCHNVHNNKFGSLREELKLLGNSDKQMKNSFLWNMDSEHEKNNSQVKAVSSYSNKIECDPVVYNHAYGGEGSLSSSSIRSSNVAMKISMQLEEDKQLSVLFTPSCDVQNHLNSGTESFPTGRETIPLELSVINSAQIKSPGNSIVNSTPGGLKRLDSLEHQHSEVGEKNCDDLTLKSTCIHVSPCLGYPGFSSSSSMEMHSSEVLSQRKDASCSACGKDGFLEVFDPTRNLEDDELANSSTCQDHMSAACAEKWERTKCVDGADTAESLQLKKSLEKTSDGSKAGKVLKRKSKHSGDEVIGCCGEVNAKILRSRKHLNDRVLPRRSMRLISK